MVRQPYYHRAVILFTATGNVSRDEVTRILNEAIGNLTKRSLGTMLADTIECEEVDAEPGDPADLG